MLQAVLPPSVLCECSFFNWSAFLLDLCLRMCVFPVTLLLALPFIHPSPATLAFTGVQGLRAINTGWDDRVPGALHLDFSARTFNPLSV